MCFNAEVLQIRAFEVSVDSYEHLRFQHKPACATSESDGRSWGPVLSCLHEFACRSATSGLTQGALLEKKPFLRGAVRRCETTTPFCSTMAFAVFWDKHVLYNVSHPYKVVKDMLRLVLLLHPLRIITCCLLAMGKSPLKIPVCFLIWISVRARATTMT